MQGHVYHWKHGWIPLTHTAALSKAKGNEKAAHEIMQGVRQDHLRRTSNVTAVAKGTRVALRDKNTGHTLTISSSHAASFHDQGHTITGVHDGSFTTKNDHGNTAQYGADGRQIVPTSGARGQQVGITQSGFLAHGLNAAGATRQSHGGFTESQRVLTLRTNFKKPGQPKEWVPGHIEKITPLDTGHADVTIRLDDGSIHVERIGKRGGGSKIQAMPPGAERGAQGDSRSVTAQQRAAEALAAAKAKNEIAHRKAS
jgi:hypothetical protein